MSCTDSWGWFILLRSLGFKVRTTQRHCGRLQTVGMGVRCLTALLETHRDIYHDVLFGNNRLVIDGCDLIKQLYFDSGRTQLRPPSSRSASKQADNKNRFKYRARLKRNRISSLECCFVYSTLTSALRGAVSWSQDTSEILTPRRNVWKMVAMGFTQLESFVLSHSANVISLVVSVEGEHLNTAYICCLALSEYLTCCIVQEEIWLIMPRNLINHLL